MLCVAYYVLIFHSIRATVIEVDVADNVLENHKSLTTLGVFTPENKFLVFKAKGCRDCDVILKPKSTRDPPYYHIYIGGWGNTRSMLAKQINATFDEVLDENDNFEPLDCNNYRDFWVTWDNGRIKVGRGKILYRDAFLSYEDTSLLPILDIEIAVEWEATVTFLFDLSYEPMCPCSCEYQKRVEFWENNPTPNHTMVEWRVILADVTDEIKRNLSINVQTTTASIRKRTSAPDDRKSAQSVGIFGCLVISLFFGSFLLCDILALRRHLATIRTLVN